jgi:hypothetical protein
MITRINAELFEWLTSATKKDTGDFKSQIHVCHDAIWTVDGCRMHCIGNPKQAYPVLFSCRPRNATELNKLIKNPPEIGPEIPGPCSEVPDIRSWIDFYRPANFYVYKDLYRKLKEINRLFHDDASKRVTLNLYDGSMTVSCKLPVFGEIPARKIGGCFGRGTFRINSQYLVDALRFGGLVEIPGDPEKYPMKISTVYHGYSCKPIEYPLTALIAGIL